MSLLSKGPVYRARLIAACLFFAWLLPHPAPGQEPAPVPVAPAAALSVEELQARQQRVREDALLEEALRTQIAELYGQAIQALQQAAEWEAQIKNWEEKAAAAPGYIEDIQKQLSQPAPEVMVEVAPEETAAELAQRLTQVRSELDAKRKEISDLEAEMQQREARRRALPELISDARARLAEAASQVNAPPAAGEARELAEARAVLLEARRAALEAEVASYEKERLNYDIRANPNLLNLRRDRAVREASLLERRAALLQEITASKRREEARLAEQQAGETLLGVEDAAPEVVAVFEELSARNAELAGLRTGPDGLVQKIERAKAEMQQLDTRLGQLERDFASIRERVERAGVSSRMGSSVGTLLRKQRSELPDAGRRTRNIRAREVLIAETDLKQIEFREQRNELADIDTMVAGYMARLAPYVEEEDQWVIERGVREALQTTQSTLDAVIADNGEYFSLLVELNLKENELIQDTRDFKDYIDERILWIKSGASFGPSNIVGGAAPLSWLFDWNNWRLTLLAVRDGAVKSPVLHSVMVLVFAVFLFSRRNLRDQIARLSERAAKPTSTSYSHAVRVLVDTLALSCLGPLVLLALSWRLAQSMDPADFGRALSDGFLNAGIVLFTLEFARQVLHPDGLAVNHFGIAGGPAKIIRRHLVWFMAITVPAVFMISTLEWRNDDTWNESLGRTVFLVQMAALMALAQVLLGGEQAPARRLLMESGVRAPNLVGRWGYVLAVVVPLALFVLAFTGYFYTASRLAWRLYISLSLGLIILLVRGMILRWLLLTRRAMAMAQAKKRREALKAKESAEGDGAAQPPGPEEIDLAAINVQTSRLVGSGLIFALVLGVWFIWADVIPALAKLNEWHVWEAGVDAEGVKQWITAADLTLALLIALMTFAAARNVPGILEIALLQRLAVGAGERYAIVTVVRYMLTGVGIVLAFNALGVGWGQVQWLVAALSLGLGFGLQEIFANFVSGLIILFERPIRVGDTVTIGNISGRVSRIRIRATTITDWDRKELVVPNKEFVTGQLINWTLSDTLIRAKIPVGIAYGSDTARAKALLEQVALDHPRVMRDPAPQATFLGFGDSALNFELRVFCPSIEDYIPILHDMHMGVERAFREAGIEIAFPQRDVHIRTIQDVLPVKAPASLLESRDVPEPEDAVK